MSREIVQRLGETVQAYQAAVTDFDRETARALGVNETDLRCLELLLGQDGGLRPAQLAEHLSLTTGSVTAMLDRLERLGYLRREPHPTDRRKTVVRATPAVAERARDLIMPLVEDGGALLAERFTDAQLELVIEFLRLDTELHARHTARLRT